MASDPRSGVRGSADSAAGNPQNVLTSRDSVHPEGEPTVRPNRRLALRSRTLFASALTPRAPMTRRWVLGFGRNPGCRASTHHSTPGLCLTLRASWIHESGPPRRTARFRRVRCAGVYATGTTGVLAGFGLRFPKVTVRSAFRRAPPSARIANPKPASSRAIPTTIPKIAVCSAR